ncbi:MAG: AAA family ATPase [Cellulomonas sp. 73-92]|uniref:RNA polymerase recycling motor ATPase HelR n=1 Tax=Cellulomonas sp. 73-92 TaxID=1895740 RepID=UPI00092B17C3|nr:RNA polymerase recycling motor ATPase HelR [Cellulomonas sp. 73-92]OJV76644.1 MAG: AAA family ATPase [Cellulomonas sp. 73-92]
MTPPTTSAFALPARLAAKADPALVGADEAHFAAVAAALERQVADLDARLDAQRRLPATLGQEAVERDQGIRRLAARLRVLRSYGLDLCLGRMVAAGDGTPVFVGRLGLADEDGRQLLVDWRSPAAEPYFGATRAHPMGLASRRRYRWTGGRVSDYWDEVFAPDGSNGAAPDDESAFIASLGASRSARMRDVLATIAADQDAIIRAGSRGALVVDGGPGTGKTVVALHRAAYLLYADPRVGRHHGGVLVVGPHEPYLAYVEDVLPSLGEEGVRTCTLRDLLPQGAGARDEPDPRVARLKASAAMVRAIEPAVAFYERPPSTATTVETPWGDVRLGPDDWAEAFDAADPGTPHNEAQDEAWEQLVAIVADRLDGVPPDELGRALRRDRDLVTTFRRAWPLLEPTDLVGDLWTVPAYLRLCAPWLAADEVAALQRPDAQAWTASDLPLLDAARRRLGDPGAARRRRQRAALLADEREQRDQVMEHLIASDDSEMLVMSMLKGADLQGALVDEAALPGVDEDPLAGPFAHVVVDEAQELTDAEWQMLLARCPSRSLTVVGDRAQARHGFTESWRERLERVGLRDVGQATLTINYRTPQEVMAEAEPVIRAAIPDANVPTSVRATGIGVTHGPASDLRAVVDAWLAAHDEGVACVVGDPGFEPGPRVRLLTPQLAKGLEFDLVVLVDPDRFGTGVEGAVDRYVAMTRATQELVILTSP